MSDDSARDSRPTRLREALEPLAAVTLEIVDDSHRHRNHPGAADGRGHFRVRVVSERFEGLTRIKRHQLVYSLVDELMKTDIHALQVDAKTPQEVA
ncbi:MAG: BolA family protein [Pseudomonadota bacterium]